MRVGNSGDLAGLHRRQAVPRDPARWCRWGEIPAALPGQWGQGRGRALPGAGGRGREPAVSSMSPSEPCPRCHLSPPWGRSAPCCGDSAGQGTRRAGTGMGTRGTTLDRPLCQGLAMARGRRQGKGEQLSTPLLLLQIATGTFVKEDDLSKLEKDTTNIRKKAPAGETSTSTHPPHPALIAPAQGRDIGCLGGGEAGCAPRAALATRLLGTRGQSRSSSLLGSLVRAEHLPWEAPQQPPSVTAFLWPLAFGKRPPCPREEAAEGGPASIPPFSPAHSCLFTKAPKSRTHRASPRSQPCQVGKERSQLLAPPMQSKLPPPRAGRCCLPGCSSFIRSRWGARRA